MCPRACVCDLLYSALFSGADTQLPVPELCPNHQRHIRGRHGKGRLREEREGLLQRITMKQQVTDHRYRTQQIADTRGDGDIGGDG